MRRPNFMPELKEMRPFRYWCQQVLPLVYDDSLGYYELLNKVVDYINNMTKDVASLGESYQKLEEYVNSHLDTQYIKTLVDDELDKMVEDGTFDEIVQSALDSKFNAYAETINGIIAEQNNTIKTRMNAQDNTINTRLNAQDNTIDTRLTAQDDRITAQSTTISGQQSSINTLNTSVTNLTNTTNTHTQDISDLDSEVSTISSTLDNQGTDISSLQTSLSNALNSINGNTAAIAGINNFITNSVVTLPHLTASTVGGETAFTKASMVAWLRYVVSHYASEITSKPFMGKYSSTNTQLFVGFAYSMNDLVDGLPKYSYFITWNNQYTYLFGTYNGVPYFKQSAGFTDKA